MQTSPLYTRNANSLVLDRLENDAAKVGLKINVNKSKEKFITLNNNETLCKNSEAIAYLGSIIDNTGGTEADIMACI